MEHEHKTQGDVIDGTRTQDSRWCKRWNTKDTQRSKALNRRISSDWYECRNLIRLMTWAVKKWGIIRTWKEKRRKQTIRILVSPHRYVCDSNSRHKRKLAI